MALKIFEPNQIIYQRNRPVDEIAIVIKGHIRLFKDKYHFDASPGTIIGLEGAPGNDRLFEYTALDDVTLYTYSYNNLEDVIEVLDENVKLAPTITQKVLLHTLSLYDLTKSIHKEAIDQYELLSTNLKKYPQLCAMSATQAMDFSELENISTPAIPITISHWKSEILKAYIDNDKSLQPLYTGDHRFCIGFIMFCSDLIREIIDDLRDILSSLNEFYTTTNTFKLTIETLTSNVKAISEGTVEIDMPSTNNLLSQILLYSNVEEETAIRAKEVFDSYVKLNDRFESTDKARALRKEITELFYIIYKQAFIKSITDPEPPDNIKLFLTFGIMDERLSSDEVLRSIFGYMKAMRPDPYSKVYTIYEWLKKIYNLEVEPSINEFQLDYQAYLRECRQNGELKADEIEKYENDPEFRLDYEIRNLFMLGNKMTFSRITIFQPAYDSQTTILPVDKSYSSTERIYDELNRIRELDYQCFYREKVYTLPTNESIQFHIHQEQTPYFILMPNAGQRMVLWQTIEGRKRNSPSRMLIPIFFENNFADCFTQLCGDFRWEMCKTEQGVRWNDITDPSLTAEYNDYLQFYKKNSQLSADSKERVKTQLKKHSNNYKRVFISDYLSYIKYESAGNMRLQKYARGIIFKYCAFKGEVRKRLLSVPSFEALIERHNTKVEQKVHPMDITIKKAASHGDPEPTELIDEIEFLRS